VLSLPSLLRVLREGIAVQPQLMPRSVGRPPRDGITRTDKIEVNYSRLAQWFAFIAERHTVFKKWLVGAKHPWTQDPILSQV
jgi:hypothetical protein